MSKEQHFSATQLGMKERCGEQYRRRYIEKQIIPPGFSLIRGTAVHHGRRVNLKQKIESQNDVAPDVVTDAVRDQVKASFAGEVLLEEEFEGKSIKTVKDECTDVSVRLAAADYTEFQRKTQPLKVEEKLTMKIPGIENRTIISYVDLYDIEEILRDLKTTKRTPPKGDEHKNEQLTIYYVSARLNKWNVKGLQLDNLVDLKGGVKADPRPTTRDMDDVQAVLNRFATAIRGIDAGIFPPCHPSFWGCSNKWCGYWNDCNYVLGRKRILSMPKPEKKEAKKKGKKNG